jgi:hypothetical protein
MTLHGLDRDTAPTAGKAKSMLDAIGGTWWNVYMGGPESGGSGWTPDRVQQYKDHGITRFLLMYVGRQSGHVPLLTTSQGKHDGREACQLAEQFGHSAANTPVCLDLEGRTFDAAQRASLDYVCGWCHAVRAHGFRPGVYSNPRALVPLHDRDDKPDWIYVASWVRHAANPGAKPRQAPGVPGKLWPDQGQRVWQYAGAFDNKACQVGGLDVDINVADGGCLAHNELTT